MSQIVRAIQGYERSSYGVRRLLQVVPSLGVIWESIGEAFMYNLAGAFGEVATSPTELDFELVAKRVLNDYQRTRKPDDDANLIGDGEYRRIEVAEMGFPRRIGQGGMAELEVWWNEFSIKVRVTAYVGRYVELKYEEGGLLEWKVCFPDGSVGAASQVRELLKKHHITFEEEY